MGIGGGIVVRVGKGCGPPCGQVVGDIGANIYWFTELVTQRTCNVFISCLYSEFVFGDSLCSLLEKPCLAPARSSSFLRFPRLLRQNRFKDGIRPVCTRSGFSISIAVVPLEGSYFFWQHCSFEDIAPDCTRFGVSVLIAIAVVPPKDSLSMWWHCPCNGTAVACTRFGFFCLSFRWYLPEVQLSCDCIVHVMVSRCFKHILRSCLPLQSYFSVARRVVLCSVIDVRWYWFYTLKPFASCSHPVTRFVHRCGLEWSVGTLFLLHDELRMIDFSVWLIEMLGDMLRRLPCVFLCRTAISSHPVQGYSILLAVRNKLFDRVFPRVAGVFAVQCGAALCIGVAVGLLFLWDFSGWLVFPMRPCENESFD